MSMRIDLPGCGFTYCKHRFDGNCMRRPEECSFAIMKNLLEEAAEEIENCYGRETELTEKIRRYI